MKLSRKTKGMLFILTILIEIIIYSLTQEREPVTILEGDHSEKSGKWHVSYSGNSHWKYLITSNVTLDKIKLGDFNSDGKTDAFATFNTPEAVILKSTDKRK